MSDFIVESGIAITNSKYPFSNMIVGDSFFIASRNYEAKVRSRVANAACYRGYRNQEVYSVRKVKGGYRCWRTK